MIIVRHALASSFLFHLTVPSSQSNFLYTACGRRYPLAASRTVTTETDYPETDYIVCRSCLVARAREHGKKLYVSPRLQGHGSLPSSHFANNPLFAHRERLRNYTQEFAAWTAFATNPPPPIPDNFFDT
mgnify:CR=1 FL=1